MRSEKPLLHGEITSSIVDAFFEVHRELGFGFREYLYARALERLLIKKGHKVDREVPVMVYFRGEPLAYERMDMVIDSKVIIENKAREPLDPDAHGQLFAALAATNLEVSFTGPLARSMALVAIVLGGLMFMYGEGGAKRQISGIVFGGGLALFAAQFLAWLF